MGNDAKISSERSRQTTTIGDVFERMTFTRAHWKIAIALFVVFVIESWEQLALVYVSDDVVKQFSLNEVQLGWLLAAVATGMIPGVLVWGPIADRIGRRKVATISLATYGVVALLSAVAPSFTVLLAIRIVAGFLFAGIYTVTFPYFLELMPTRVRGRATVLLSIGWPIGVLLALGVTVTFSSLGWRAVVLASAAACLWLFVIRAWVPESPHWLAIKGRDSEASTVLRKLGVEIPEGTKFEMKASALGNPIKLVQKPFLRITIQMLIVNFAFNWGYWGLQVWLPTLLQQRGLSLSDSLGFVAISAMFMIPGYLVASFLTTRWGRRAVFLLFIGGAIAGGVLFALSWDLTSLNVANFILSFFILGGWGIWNTWNGELYPTSLRNTGFSWATSAQLISNAIAPAVIGVMLAGAASFSTTVLFIVAFLVVTFLAAMTLPETEGKELS
ncbi:MFS transporter [Arthrobacter cryoconiti]|uniref:MFS transporter n=1 Tax=Arthrobacter cryoconiti TaxID=748907 RepID=A0ABV8R0Y6_9MICC|nr:MFS transporter [Arthrobacter cryoconiti]MCC9068598.1 MFS transporter [Arthrobacter cryoconiti]